MCDSLSCVSGDTHNLANELIPLYWGLRSALESKGGHLLGGSLAAGTAAAQAAPLKLPSKGAALKRGNYMQQLNNLRGG